MSAQSAAESTPTREQRIEAIMQDLLSSVSAEVAQGPS
jgi:hypothetical protein